MVLYLIRHSEIEKNKYDLVQRQIECDLNIKGIDVTKLVIPLVRDINIDMIVSSPLERTINIAKMIKEGRFPIKYG